MAKCEVDSDFLAKAASHVEKASSLDYGASDTNTLPPATPLDGEWDCQPGKQFSEGNNNGLTHQGRKEVDRGGIRKEGEEEEDEEQGEGGDTPGIAAARAEALNDALRPLDR